MPKPGWDQYFLNIAVAVSDRSSCTRSKVGAVVVDADHRVVSIGYNDSPAGEPGCEVCPRRMSGCAPGVSYSDPSTRCHSVHAEANALIYAARERLVGSTIYITREACFDCTKLIKAAGINRIVVTPTIEEDL